MEKSPKYEKAKLEIVLFDAKDVIATSTLGGETNSTDDYGWTKPGTNWS